MAQNRNETSTVLIYRTKCIEGNWIEMVVAGYFGVFLSLRLAAASAAEAAQAEDMLR